MMNVILFVVLLHFRVSVNFAVEAHHYCGYERCPVLMPNMLNVHLICHSHDDAGWLKTFEQYFLGTNKTLAKEGVRFILDSVVSELLHDSSKRFTYAETSFFWRWWQTKNDHIRHIVKRLVSKGQLEFVGGGMVQNDEASPHYTAIIDQMTMGHDFLRRTFNECAVPTVSWQIDTFGHSSENCALFLQMGLKGMFFARLHYNDRQKRIQERSLEAFWDCSGTTGTKERMLTSVFYEHYMPPSRFCFDASCMDDPIVEDPTSPSYNIEDLAKAFINVSTQQAKAFRTNNIMMLMGGDFHYMSAGIWFNNLDKLMNYINHMQSNGNKINVIYSTPTCYYRALKKSGQEVQFPVKKDDFFPGTAKQHVTNDYYRMLDNGIMECQTVFNDAMKKIATLNGSVSPLPEQKFCPLINGTVCDVSQHSYDFIVTFFNGFSHSLQEFARIPVSDSDYKVYDSRYQLVKSEGIWVQEMRQKFAPWLSQVVRLYENSSFIEMEWTIGPIPIDDGVSKEIASRFSSKIKSNGTFFTDSNGRQLIKRVRNFQPTYEYNDSEPVAGNYYPVTRMVYLMDDSVQMVVLTDRSQGVSSLQDGCIEILLHRRLLYDDHFGVDEALNEKESGKGLVVRGRHWLMVGKAVSDNPIPVSLQLFMQKFYEPILMFAPVTNRFALGAIASEFSALSRPLPPCGHVLTLSQLLNGKILLRLENYCQRKSGTADDGSVLIDLQGLFTTFDVEAIEETNLTGGHLKVPGNATSSHSPTELKDLLWLSLAFTVRRRIEQNCLKQPSQLEDMRRQPSSSTDEENDEHEMAVIDTYKTDVELCRQVVWSLTVRFDGARSSWH
ncbi:unnamed protein product [Soboliphyme baturini]|uniref:Alpha-mannosidase n=1 Tax=Soboliphyme baturini TaxID=241478 RepID=A0A183IAW7_9BILA|nr:unnamed protein product [Soboliphyme baturini]